MNRTCCPMVHLELFLHRCLQSGFISNHQVVAFQSAVFLRAQVEAAPENTLLAIFTGLISNDLLRIADDLTERVREIQLKYSGLAVGSHRFLLVEVQRENHVADFPVCGQQAQLHGLRVVLASIPLVFLVLVAQESIIHHGDNHLLQADAAVNKLQTAAALLNPNILSWRPRLISLLAANEVYREQVVRMCPAAGNQVATLNLHILSAGSGFVHLSVFGEGAV